MTLMGYQGILASRNMSQYICDLTTVFKMMLWGATQPLHQYPRVHLHKYTKHNYLNNRLTLSVVRYPTPAGQFVLDVANESPSYLNWMLQVCLACMAVQAGI